MPDTPSDAGPHATPDQVRAALKRRDALATAQGRTAAPVERHAPDQETARRGKRDK